MGIQHADEVFGEIWGPPRTNRAVAVSTRNGSKFESSCEKDLYAYQTYHGEDDDAIFGDLLSAPSELDRQVPVTLFADVKGARLRRERMSLRQLEQHISATSAETKSDLPLLKLARFGDKPKPRKNGQPGKCLRWDENLTSVSGIEGDYDAGEVSMQDAAELLQDAGIAALFYTSTHHDPDAPRWRVICPLDKEVSRGEREALCAKLNGALGGILGEESFKPSQSYYFGHAAKRDSKKGGGRAHPCETLLIEGKPLDRVSGLRPIYARTKQSEEDVFGDLLSTHSERKGHGKSGKPFSVIESALMAIPNDGRPDWQRFCDYGMALHEEANGSQDGFRAFVQWSRQNPNFDMRECRAIWNGLKSGQPGNIGGGTILKEAASWGWIETLDDDDFEDFGEEEESGDAAQSEKPKKGRFTLRKLSDCTSEGNRQYLIKGLLAARDVGCIVGAPGAGKSLLAPYLAHAVAQGREAFGMRTKAGGTFYVAAEDPHGLRGRANALREMYGDTDAFTLIEGVSDLLADKSPDFAELKSLVKEQRPALIVIDTLAMAFPGLEENSAEGMGRVVAVARALTRWGAAVLLVHHDTKDGQQGLPRGHSLLNGALDIALHIKRDDKGIIRGKLTKNRNGPCDRELAFRIDVQHAGHDEDGDPITLPYCQELTEEETKTASRAVRLSPAEKAVIQHFHEVRGDAEQVEEDELRRACVDGRSVSASDKPDNRRRAAVRALSGLVRKGILRCEAGQFALSELSGGDEFENYDDLEECGAEYVPDKARTIRTEGQASENEQHFKAGQSRTKPDKSRTVRHGKPEDGRTGQDRGSIALSVLSDRPMPRVLEGL
ncbi:AAA family ATPase [Mangrovicoccus ximenensis]|uniref:AAA family ATPase n=1 Tax=Mangrovicoccus ximenensis TaxID=1911570 RepID=UPI000D354560|nr:AAA family ATPase [Mangrovicoccus ximenensis]